MDRPLHEALWLSCPVKRCCSVRTVLPTGADIWRIATNLQVAPEHFLRAIPAPHGIDDDAFLLDHAQKPLHAALAKRPVKGRAAPCTFLLLFGDQTARCGLGALRPRSCQAFPASGTPPCVDIADDHGCTCRTWTLADLDRRHVSGLLQQTEIERQHYHAVLRGWNALVLQAPANKGFGFGDFCHYVLAASAPPAPQSVLGGGQ